MAFSREFIRKAAKESGVELPKEMEDALIQEHISTRDAFAAEKAKAALEENKPEPAPAVKDSQEYKDLRQSYKDLKKEFDDYKSGVAAKELYGAKEKAFRAILKKANMSHIETIVRAAKADGVIDNIELDENGGAKDADKLENSVKTDWADFVVYTNTQGADISHPPASLGGVPHTMTKEEIFAIKDTAQRQKAMAQNLDLFGIK